MKKLTTHKLIKLLKIFNNGYYSCYNTRIKSNIYCTVFKLSEPLTEVQKKIISGLFSNVIVGYTTIILF